jgi:hypothetical protein
VALPAVWMRTLPGMVQQVAVRRAAPGVTPR